MTTRQLARSATALGLALMVVLPTVALADDLNVNDLGINAIEKGGLKLGGNDVRGTAAKIINVALGFLGIIAIIIVLLGGFKYMVAGGNEEKTAEARKLIVSGIIGLAIILSAWAITTFVVGNLVNATGDTP